MGWPVYSERLCSSNTAAAWVVWSVPAGKRAILRSMTVCTGSTAGGVAMASIAGTAFWTSANQVPNRTDVVSLYHVAYQGEGIGLWVPASGCDMIVSGYLFDDPSGAVGPPGLMQEWVPSRPGELPT